MTTMQIKTGNLLDVKKGHIVHGCNAQGVMGSGVALAVKETYPEAYSNYVGLYKSTGLALGRAYPVFIQPGLVVWNAITQTFYGAGQRQVSYDAIQSCFEEVNRTIAGDLYDRAQNPDPELDTIHIPMIGAARGGGDWEIIRTIIERTVDYPVVLWLPDHTVTTL